MERKSTMKIVIPHGEGLRRVSAKYEGSLGGHPFNKGEIRAFHLIVSSPAE